MIAPTTDLVELHLHVGGAVAPHILWAIAHDLGFKLPVKSYWDFCELVTADSSKISSLGDYLQIMHLWTEKIQSSPSAIERSIYEVIGKEYRSSRVSMIELRFNPMKRNLEGERDLDYIIAAALRGMDRACLAYGVKAGLIFCLAREFEYELNEILVKKAIKYLGRGVIGIDLAGPESHTLELGKDVLRYRDLFARARAAGLGTTVHTGETSHTGPEGVLAVLSELKPARIGHGIAAAASDEAIKRLRDENVVLEICPTSNLRTHAIRDLQELKGILDKLRAGGVKLTINTDATYMINTTLRREFDLLIENGVIDDAEAARCIDTARASTFIR